MSILVLASKSPRRCEILRNAGFHFVVRSAEVEEVRKPGEHPEAYVLRLSRAKAEAVPAAAREVILGADTVVVVDDHVLEKPVDADGARRMLRLLSGREHRVITGICIRAGGVVVVSGAETTGVRFHALSDAEIDDYVASGEPMDKAGAYAIQGLASKFIERVNGCYFNVVGLPIARVYRHLRELG